MRHRLLTLRARHLTLGMQAKKRLVYVVAHFMGVSSSLCAPQAPDTMGKTLDTWHASKKTLDVCCRAFDGGQQQLVCATGS